MSKAKEFWLTNDGKIVYNSDDSEYIQYHLIEHSAYTALKEEADKLAEMNKALFTDPDGKGCFSGSDGDKKYFTEALTSYTEFTKGLEDNDD